MCLHVECPSLLTPSPLSSSPLPPPSFSSSHSPPPPSLHALQATSSMKDQTLKAIDQSVVTAAKFLGDFASDEKKRECLKAYAESTKIVQWIRKETRGKLDIL